MVGKKQIFTPTLSDHETDNTNLYDYLRTMKIEYWKVLKVFNHPKFKTDESNSASEIQFILKLSLQNENF